MPCTAEPKISIVKGEEMRSCEKSQRKKKINFIFQKQLML